MGYDTDTKYFLKVRIPCIQNTLKNYKINSLIRRTSKFAEKELSCLKKRKGICLVFVYVLRRENSYVLFMSGLFFFKS